MSTTKTVNVTTGKVLNYQIKKAGYKPVIGSVYVDSDKTIDIDLIPSSSSSEVYSLGDRILGIASFVCYYTPGGDYDTDPIDTAVATQTVGSGLQNVGVKKSTFRNAVSSTDGEYYFEYDGTDWNMSSSIESGSSVVNLSDYGVFFNTAVSTLNSGDTIKIDYTLYNKYACFVLDANYRTNTSFGYTGTDFPNYPNYTSYNGGSGSSTTVWYYNQLYGQESATWCNQQLLDNRGYSQSGLPAMYYCRNKGIFILPNGIQLNALVPNLSELYKIWQNRAYLDSIDPVIQSGSTSYNLSNWSFSNNSVWGCQEYNNNDVTRVTNGGSVTNIYKPETAGVIPIFEIPCK